MARRPQVISKVPSKFLKPLQLKEVLFGGVKHRLSGICFSEISLLFLCLKKSGFNEDVCSQEILNFQKCYNAHFKKKYSKDSASSKKIATPEDINKLLARYPNIKER